MYTVYILHTSRNTLYTGQTADLAKRISQHRLKTPQSAKYMRTCTSFELVYTENFATRSEALKREAAIKKLTRPQKDHLISSKKM